MGKVVIPGSRFKIQGFALRVDAAADCFFQSLFPLLLFSHSPILAIPPYFFQPVAGYTAMLLLIGGWGL
jgi:hypothetical protein